MAFIPQPFSLEDAREQIAAEVSMWQRGAGASLAVVEAASDRSLEAVVLVGPDGHQATLRCRFVGEPRDLRRGEPVDCVVCSLSRRHQAVTAGSE